MKTTKASDLSCLRWYGRTYKDQELTYFNWTDAGFELDFEGTFLIADLHVIPYVIQDPYVDAITQEALVRDLTDWPWIAVFLDGSDVPYRTFPVNAEDQTVMLFYAAEPEHHRIRVAKLSEGAVYKMALRSLSYEGNIAAPVVEYDGTIEFIGDSITCGFGNGIADASRRFYAVDENGWVTYAGIAARNLNLDFNVIAVSGITLVPDPVYMPYTFGMKDVYLYTDKLLEEKLGHTENFEKWDFSANPKDVVVINLGTNDATAIIKSRDLSQEEVFKQEYILFLKKIRSLYGEKTKIVAAMGGIDYYLYDTIREAVEDYKKETGDEAVWPFKFGKMMPETEDVGACTHPTITLHRRMGAELTAFLQKIL